MTDQKPLSLFDRPNSYIGRTQPRREAARLMEGRGRFVDDLTLPRMVHAAFVRSPHAHARIVAIDTAAAAAATGVIAVYTGGDIAAHVEPYVGVLTHLAGLRSAPQFPLALDVARWQGEPVAMVVARSRAEAEDACALIEPDYAPLAPVTDPRTATHPDTPVIHPELGSNLAWERTVEAGDVDAVWARDDVTVARRTFRFGRHTGVTLEPRGCVFEYDPGEDRLTFHYSGQAPHMMQAVIARHLRLPEANVRVVARDVGGSFGIKIHTYGDEIATAVAARLLRRPVKFVADRQESFLSDIHARDHIVDGRLALDADGRIAALEIDDLTGIGPYSMYPRTSAIEANQVVNLCGGPYRIGAYRARARVVFQTKNMMCQYRAVGHPVAMAVCDGLIEDAARQAGLDPIEVRRRNLIPDDGYPAVSASGMRLDELSHHASLSRLLELMDIDGRRAAVAAARAKGALRGLGFVSMIEVTNPSPMFYGMGGAPIAAQDGATLKLEPGGSVTLAASVTEQGQGTNTVLGQIAADALGLSPERIRVSTGDTDAVPYGGGTWASRGAGIGGEAVLRAGLALRAQILDVAGALIQADPQTLDLREGHVIDPTGAARMSLEEIARIVYYRGNELPDDLQPELVATRHFRVTGVPFVFTNAAMAAEVEIDEGTGIVRVLNVWCVEDCGRIINPGLVDEQIRGGVVQGIGGALFEECLYDAAGQMRNTSMADYLVPMAAEMPDIHVAHVETPTSTSTLGAKGAGEAGTGGAPAAILNAVNDALSPRGASIWQMPMTPERVLRALGAIGGGDGGARR